MHTLYTPNTGKLIFNAMNAHKHVHAANVKLMQLHLNYINNIHPECKYSNVYMISQTYHENLL